MLDNNYELLYFMVTGKIYKKQDEYKQMNGGVKYVDKSRGFRSIIKYFKLFNHHLSFHLNKGK